jgi:3-oxo-5alpha-steroid 4-dehydrogenase
MEVPVTGAIAARSSPIREEETDVVVLGFGAAGACAAIEAADAGARVTVLDRWGGGGATARSGGVVYAGGGTPEQRAAGFADDPDAMYAYLRHEEGAAVDEATLRRFCERSAADLAWLRAMGVEIAPGFDAAKAVVPADDEVGLYFSGNERQDAGDRRAVPRGHRVAGRGMTGRDLYDALATAAARRRGITARLGVRPLRLLVDHGRVVGVEVRELHDRPGVTRRHRALFALATTSGQLLRRPVPAVWRAIDRLEGTRSDHRRILARGGVVIATGGFAFNPALLAVEAPAYARSMPLGTAGDDGSGIELGRRVGAAVRMMDHCAASRFIAPPVALCEGVLVDAAGARICDESLYAATLSRHIAHHGGRAWLVVDDTVRRRVVDELHRLPGLAGHRPSDLLRGRINHVLFPHLFGRINLYVNRERAPSTATLAERCGIDPDGLTTALEEYNRRARAGNPDPMGKAAALVRPLENPPFLAIPCHLDGWLFPAPTITLGGLDVDGLTAAVRRPDGSPIPGLFAAGRAAAGVASRSYVSGLSLADCVFSGRNAGGSAAAAARPSVPAVSS